MFEGVTAHSCHMFISLVRPAGDLVLFSLFHNQHTNVLSCFRDSKHCTAKQTLFNTNGNSRYFVSLLTGLSCKIAVLQAFIAFDMVSFSQMTFSVHIFSLYRLYYEIFTLTC